MNHPVAVFFKSPDTKQKSKSPESETSLQVGASKLPAESTALSPAKRVTLRTQCIYRAVGEVAQLKVTVNSLISRARSIYPPYKTLGDTA